MKLKKVIISLIAAMFMTMSFFSAGAVQKNDGWYDDLILSKDYLNYGNMISEMDGYIMDAYKLIDIDQNGIPELVIQGYQIKPWFGYKIFTYDTVTEEPVFVGEVSLYSTVRYSTKYHAIVGSPTRPNQYGYGSQFIGIENENLKNLFYVGGGINTQGQNEYHISGQNSSDIFDGAISITENEYNQYLEELTEIKFDAISNYVPAEQPVPGLFYDVPENAWYYDAVKYVYDNNLMNGTSATRFSPDGQTNRAMIVTILYRIAGEPDAGTPIFFDIPRSAYYSEAVTWAAAKGIVTGASSTAFAPDDPVTREQLATFLCRYAAYQGINTKTSNDLTEFVDSYQISDYAVEAMGWAYDQGLITGKSSMLLKPKDYATRAEVALVLTRYCEMF